MAVYFCGLDPSYVARIGKHSPRNFRERESRMTIRQLALQLRIILPVFSTLLFSAISYAVFCLKKKNSYTLQAWHPPVVRRRYSHRCACTLGPSRATVHLLL